MRKHERFDSAVPIKINYANISRQIPTSLVNISYGGLSCHFAEPVTIGNEIDIQIDMVEPSCDLNGAIRWCRKFGDHYEIGVEFKQDVDPFLKRMVEQICHIEEYRQQALIEEGRELTSEQAAKEWIEKFAADFPQ